MTQPSRPAVPPNLAIAFGILAASTAAIFIRYAQQEAPSLVVAAWRLTIASLVLAPLALTRHRAELARLSRIDWALALLSGLFLAIHFATWITSLEYTSVASSVVLVTTTPLWVALISPFTLRERLGKAVIAGMLLALAGGTIVALSDACTLQAGRFSCPGLGDSLGGRASLGNLMAIAGAIAAASYMTLGRRLRRGMSLVGYIFVVYSMAAVVLVVMMFSAGLSPFGYSPPIYLWLVLLALVPQLIGHSTFNWALGYLPAAFVSITLLGEPIGSTVLAYFLLGETPTAIKLGGALLILLGIYLASTKPKEPYTS